METIKIALVYLMEFISWAIIIKALLSWFPDSIGYKLYGFLEDITSPVEEPIRRVISRFNTGTIDFTPLVAILLLGFIKRMIYMARNQKRKVGRHPST